MALPQTGTYTINITPPGLQSLSAAIAITKNVAQALTPGTAHSQTLNFGVQAGEAARFTFTVASGQSATASLSGGTTTPSGAQIWMGVYNLNQGYVTGAATTSGETLNLNLSAGTYYLWIGPETMVTSGAVQFSFQ